MEDQLDSEKPEDFSPIDQDDSSHSSNEERIISWPRSDPDNPINWPQRKKAFAIFAAMTSVFNSTFASSIVSGAYEELGAYFNITSTEELVLPISLFLVGYTVGPFMFGPLSETFGRKPVMITAFAFFTIFTMACALANTFAALVVFRLLVGVPGSCAISVVGGICADVYNDPTSRGRAMALFMACTVFGPLIAPIISGFISKVSWRWSFWVDLSICGITWIPLLLMPETYAPVLLKRRAVKLRKETDNQDLRAPLEVESKGAGYIVKVVLARPFRMLFREPLVFFSCIYMGFIYGLLYIFFEAYPIIYQETYGFNAGETGLAYLPIGIGAVFASAFSIWYDTYLARARARHANWTRTEEARRLPLACIAGPFMVIGLFWTGWTARRSIHWIIPILAGIPFGFGYLIMFIGLLNYIVDAYKMFAASAMSATGTSRSVFGAVLPFAAEPLYRGLGVAWACSLLGFVTLVLCAVPFVFWRFGDRIRENSRFCQELAEMERREKDGDGAGGRRANEGLGGDEERDAGRS
ncbi:MFS general substrate transporter [Saccharata proteae CBS 121410]|uniref:MFS general substrate transporter n=1 Tax=Saccharata proteae CBS 121410 TaxID=1314787 RepID=A0A9P4HSG4_9PEZI|nr:MFS general substrate transporter [Saccharata proteae CBS 121410]